MEVIDLEYQYMNELAKQTILISVLLSGFSFTVLIDMISNKESTSLTSKIFTASAIAAASFLITIFGMTKILMMTTVGFPFASEITSADFAFPRMVSFMFLICGIIALLTVLGLSGWVISKKKGLFTTGISIIAFVLIILFMS